MDVTTAKLLAALLIGAMAGINLIPAARQTPSFRAGKDSAGRVAAN
ncbi:hypothetical protein GGI1_20558 [Acidithiobacillus sp. GGI-221]|nr:hypothetical protein GGI1_20558 [Acidithiobacillus sp. GGI-221]